MNLPKQRIYRAMVRSGLIHESQIPEVNRKLNYDVTVQRSFLRLWRSKKGRLYPGMRGLMKWMLLHREAILQILGLIIMLADEGPKKEEKPLEVGENSIPVRPNYFDELKRINDGPKKEDDSIGDVVNKITDEEDEEDDEEDDIVE